MKIFMYSLQNEYLVSYLHWTLYFLYLVVTLFGVCGLVINVELAAYESVLHLSPTDARKSVLAKVCGYILFIKFNILYTDLVMKFFGDLYFRNKYFRLLFLPRRLCFYWDMCVCLLVFA